MAETDLDEFSRTTATINRIAGQLRILASIIETFRPGDSQNPYRDSVHTLGMRRNVLRAIQHCINSLPLDELIH